MESGPGALPGFKCWRAAVNSLCEKLSEIFTASGVVTLQSLCPGPVPGLSGWAYPKQLGLSSTACGLVLDDSIRPCTNGVSLLHRIVSVAPLSKLQTMY